MERLTGRQREIIELLAGGKNVSDIAALLHLSVSTIRRHLSLAYEALHVRNQTQAVASLLTYQEEADLDGQTTEDYLTEREQEVLALHKEGLASKEIAARLSISPSTVRQYLSRIRQKASANGTV